MAEHTAGRKMGCMKNGCEWQGKEPRLCPLQFIGSRGATPLETLHAVAVNVADTLRH
jgi:hypothetical protein